MSQKSESMKQLITQTGTPFVGRGKFPILILGLSLLLVAVALFVALPNRTATSETETAALSLAANPELRVVQRWAADADKRAKANYLAENPELKVANSKGIDPTGAEAAFLARSPKLTIAGSRSEVMAAGGYASFLARNPELKVASHYTRPSGRGLQVDYLGIRSGLTADKRYAADAQEQEIPFEPVEREILLVPRYTGETGSQKVDESSTPNPDLRHFRPH